MEQARPMMKSVLYFPSYDTPVSRMHRHNVKCRYSYWGPDHDDIVRGNSSDLGRGEGCVEKHTPYLYGEY